MAYNVSIKAYGSTTELIVDGNDAPPASGITCKVYNGTSWVTATPKVYDSATSTWVTATPKVRDSGAWVG